MNCDDFDYLLPLQAVEIGIIGCGVFYWLLSLIRRNLCGSIRRGNLLDEILLISIGQVENCPSLYGEELMDEVISECCMFLLHITNL